MKTAIFTLAVASSTLVNGALLRSGSMTEQADMSLQTWTSKWTTGPTCAYWCKKNFYKKDGSKKDPTAVCNYMHKNKVTKCTGCDPCVASGPAAKTGPGMAFMNDPIMKQAAADSGLTAVEFGKKVAHLNPLQRLKVAKLAAKHAAKKAEKNAAKAAQISGFKEAADAMQKEVNESKEKAIFQSAINNLPRARAICKKYGQCVKEGTGVVTDEDAVSSYGTNLGVKKVIPAKCSQCPDLTTKCKKGESYTEYVEYLKCKKNEKKMK
jgi:hypothetical protein